MKSMSVSSVELGERVKSAREERGLSQKQLADLAGIGKTAMFDLEHGNPGVRFNTLLAVLDVLGLSLQLATPDTAAPAEPKGPATLEPEALPDHLL